MIARLLIPHNNNNDIDNNNNGNGSGHGNVKDYGPHPFVIQLRCLDTHEPLPGITLLDIGHKMGYNTMDNGAMRLSHVRVSDFALLAKYHRISHHVIQNNINTMNNMNINNNTNISDNNNYYNNNNSDNNNNANDSDKDRNNIVVSGRDMKRAARRSGVEYSYSRPPHSKLGYGAMTWTRVAIVGGASLSLGQAVCIATRYALRRRQFRRSVMTSSSSNKSNANANANANANGNGDGSGSELEVLLLDYKLHQSRLLPLVAASYAFAFIGQYLHQRYNHIQMQINTTNNYDKSDGESNKKREFVLSKFIFGYSLKKLSDLFL